MKRLLLLLVAVVAFAQVGLQSLPDIVGDGAVHPLASTATPAIWVQMTAPSANTGTIRYGDVNITTSRGAIIEAGHGQMLPVPLGYGLNQIYTLVPVGSTLTITYQP